MRFTITINCLNDWLNDLLNDLLNNLLCMSDTDAHKSPPTDALPTRSSGANPGVLSTLLALFLGLHDVCLVCVDTDHPCLTNACL